MKKITKALAWMLLATLPAGAAQAETIARAAKPVALKDFERYPSLACDAETHAWTLRSNEADALKDRFEAYAEDNSVELCAFWLEVRGDAVTGLWMPALCLRYEGREAIEATAISILADGVRYDLAARSVEDEEAGEQIIAPLTAEAVQAFRKVVGAEEVQLRLHGEESYTAEIDFDTTNTRRRIEAASFNGLAAGLEQLDALGVSEYALWDLSFANWEAQHGFAPMFEQNIVENTVAGETLRDDFGMIESGDTGAAAKVAQQLLIDAGFMSGSASTTYGSLSTAAARRAQKFLGRIETGCMDAGLERALTAGAASAAQDESEIAWRNLGGVAQVAVERYWLADGVGASKAQDGIQTVYNSDNVLFVADGRIQNLSAEELKLFSQVEASVCFDEYAYEATVLCEVNDGAALDMSMLPMAEARLILMAETPQALAQQPGWRIQLTAGGATVDYDLE